MDTKKTGGIAALILTGALGGALLLGDAQAGDEVLSADNCAIVEAAHPGRTCADMVSSAANRMLAHSKRIIKAKRDAKLDKLEATGGADWATVKAKLDKVELNPVVVEPVEK